MVISGSHVIRRPSTPSARSLSAELYRKDEDCDKQSDPFTCQKATTDGIRCPCASCPRFPNHPSRDRCPLRGQKRNAPRSSSDLEDSASELTANPERPSNSSPYSNNEYQSRTNNSASRNTQDVSKRFTHAQKISG
jgi:hypothetical protein